MRVLNLYSGLGGNRKNWNGVEVTAVEADERIAAVYHRQHPDDELVIGDAHQYLLDHYTEFDFIKRPDGIQLIMTFRSSDIFLGFPYDALVGFLLLDYVAHKVQMKAHSISYNFINVHIYKEHIEAIKSYLNTPYGEGILTIHEPGKIDGYEIKIKNQGKYIKAPLVL